MLLERIKVDLGNVATRLEDDAEELREKARVLAARAKDIRDALKSMDKQTASRQSNVA